MKNGHVSARQGCATLNALFPFAVIIHGSSAFLLALHGHWLLFLVDFMVIRKRVHKIVGDREEGIYDAKTIFDNGRIVRHMRKIYVYLIYFVLCHFIYVPR